MRVDAGLTQAGGLLRAICLAVLAATASACTSKTNLADHDLATYIDTLHAIDSHAHPMAYVPAGAPPDTEYDALPLDGLPPFELPPGLRASNPSYRDAQHALYAITSTDTGAAYIATVAQARAQRLLKDGNQFPALVLDQLHIDVMLANRVAMGTGLASPRFRWVAFADPLTLPLDTRGEAERTPDTKPLYPLEAKLLHRYMHALGVTKLPSTLDRYQHDVVSATLERQHAAGAVAIKFEAAYLRALDFDAADSAAAAVIYARFAAGGVPTLREYKTLQDYLVRFIAREAGRLAMAVQIHSLNGFGGSYSAAGAAPHLLASMLSDSSLRATHFVIIHGGWPLVDETLPLLNEPNVYTDLSMMDQLAKPVELAKAIRAWLAVRPEKVMFGTDAFDAGPQQAWEQVGWVASRNARRALTDALSGMVRDTLISARRARDIATMVLRGNAIAAYRLSDTSQR